MYEAIKLLEGLKWGVAGRNEEKLKTILKEMGDKSNKDISATPIIVADVNDESSLAKMAEQAKVRNFSICKKVKTLTLHAFISFFKIIVNCCGPYRFYGEPVVKAW